jgi:DNA-binding HxlR family transcriptional regulator
MSQTYTQNRMDRLQRDGLVTRGSHHGAPYKLTDAGRALGPIYVAVEQWANSPVATAGQANHPGTTRFSRQNSAATIGLFSHAHQPQPMGSGGHFR